MTKKRSSAFRPLLTVTAVVAAVASGLPSPALAGNPCAPKQSNPCAPKAANPCAPKAAKPEIDPKLVMRPAGTKLAQGDPAALIKEGEALFKDTKLSTNGMACETCHADHSAFQDTFAKPYPHAVAMATEKGGVAQVHLDEMVQICMVAPMEAKPLPWDSRALAALTAYTAELQKTFKAQAAPPANPCAPRKP